MKIDSLDGILCEKRDAKKKEKGIGYSSFKLQKKKNNRTIRVIIVKDDKGKLKKKNQKGSLL